MKRWITVLMVFVLLFSMMAACGQAEPTPDPSADPDQNISVDPDGQEDPKEKTPDQDIPPESSEPEENTDPEYPTPQELDWVIEQPEKLSYEEYFSEDRSYETSNNWLVPDGDVYKGYFLNLHIVHGLQVCRWIQDAWSEENAIYTVPNTTDLGGWEQWHLVGTDGTTAYVMKLGDVNYIISVDLLTGDRQLIVEEAIITNAVYCGDVIFYGLYTDGTIQIVRHYIPTGDEMIYPTGQKLVHMFSVHKPSSSASPITWTGVTEEMTAAVISEIQNPDSEYRITGSTDGNTYALLWEQEEPWIYGEHNPLHWLCCDLQEATGYRTLYDCTILPDGSMVSEATGVVDGCWYGSDFNHDHYNPDADPPAKLTVRKGSWKPFVEEMRSTGEDSSEFKLKVHQDRVYEMDGNTFTLVTDMPVLSVNRTYADQSDSLNAYYGITPDNKLVRIYLDGQTPSVLYEGTDLKYFDSDGGYLLVLDGDSIIQLDVENQRYRTILTHKDLRYASLYDNTLYITLLSGLHVAAYLYDLSTGKLTETNYIL